MTPVTRYVESQVTTFFRNMSVNLTNMMCSKACSDLMSVKVRGDNNDVISLLNSDDLQQCCSTFRFPNAQSYGFCLDNINLSLQT